MNEEYSFENFQKRKKEIKNKPSKTKLSKLFLNTFLSFLLLFLVIGLLISPRLNLPANSNNEETTTEKPKADARIDSRLVDIQTADNTPAPTPEPTQQKFPLSMDLFNKKPAEDNSLPIFDAPQLPSQNYIRTQMPSKEQKTETTNTNQELKQQPTSTTATPSIPPAKVYKILVGDYMLEDDAKTIQDLLLTANVKSTIKQHNGNYVLQVGAYSDYAKAQKIAAQYKAKNYKVRIIED